MSQDHVLLLLLCDLSHWWFIESLFLLFLKCDVCPEINACVRVRLCQRRVWLSTSRFFPVVFYSSFLKALNRLLEYSSCLLSVKIIIIHRYPYLPVIELESLLESLIRAAFLNQWSFWWTDINVGFYCHKLQSVADAPVLSFEQTCENYFQKKIFFPIFPCEKPCVVLLLFSCVCCRKDALLFFN